MNCEFDTPRLMRGSERPTGSRLRADVFELGCPELEPGQATYLPVLWRGPGCKYWAGICCPRTHKVVRQPFDAPEHTDTVFWFQKAIFSDAYVRWLICYPVRIPKVGRGFVLRVGNRSHCQSPGGGLVWVTIHEYGLAAADEERSVPSRAQDAPVRGGEHD